LSSAPISPPSWLHDCMMVIAYRKDPSLMATNENR
jgi:hypothetical protein